MAAAKYSRYFTYIKPVIGNKLVKSVAPYIFSLITMSILIVFAISPTVSTILNLQQDIQNHRQILDALNSKEENLTLGRNNLQALGQEKRGKINTAVPENPDVTSLISNLRRASPASTSAVQIQPVVLLDNTKPGQNALLNLGEVSFSFNIQGSYGQLLSTLYNLQKSSRLLNISNITIGKQVEGSTVLSVTGKAYYLR